MPIRRFCKLTNARSLQTASKGATGKPLPPWLTLCNRIRCMQPCKSAPLRSGLADVICATSALACSAPAGAAEGADKPHSWWIELLGQGKTEGLVQKLLAEQGLAAAVLVAAGLLLLFFLGKLAWKAVESHWADVK